MIGEFRKAQSGDAARISELIHSVAHYFSTNSAAELPDWFMDSITSAIIASNIADPRFNYLIACADDTLAGVIGLRDASHVYHLFVAPEFQRRGIAGMLWQRAKADAMEDGNTGDFTVRSSEYAVPVYHRFGFHVNGERAGKDGIAFVPMRLRV